MRTCRRADFFPFPIQTVSCGLALLSTRTEQVTSRLKVKVDLLVLVSLYRFWGDTPLLLRSRCVDYRCLARNIWQSGYLSITYVLDSRDILTIGRKTWIAHVSTPAHFAMGNTPTGSSSTVLAIAVCVGGDERLSRLGGCRLHLGSSSGSEPCWEVERGKVFGSVRYVKSSNPKFSSCTV